MSVARKIRTLATTGWRRQAMVAEACGAMLAARVTLAIHPFSRVSKSLGDFTRPDDPRATDHAAPTDEADAATARAVRWAIRASAPFLPFRTVCLQQAMAARVMLKRRGIASVMHFGAPAEGERPIDAHAWLDAAGIKVTGYPLPDGMQEIACFVGPPAPSAE
ncbi:lasso peptide biosynthesis B2 protein [Sphingomonas bacterium]|uniref:lasso peptide biosynthesis B2 protein n=1 Tax=Sphingomonas bacterium TaxID=1895847 RepID=UPI00260E8307|nr:lasso peptide biosynthesis B2 protein [Sphingomonas bacterium]MDB5679059.1 hypothetical protein [Sphingomonas bacterium]MDB5712310.1 hypothetical protein [Sphingomonas bacterium]